VLVAALALIGGMAYGRFHWSSGNDTHFTAAPDVIEMLLLDAQSDRPVEGVRVTFDSIPAVGLGRGRFAARMPGSLPPGQVRAEGYRPVEVPARRDAGLALHLVPAVIRGIVHDADGAPIPRALVRLNQQMARTESDGRFQLHEVGAAPVVAVSAPGYAAARVTVGDRVDLDVQLGTQELHAVYLSSYGVADAELRDNVLSLLQGGQANAIVLDVKGERGYLAYRSDVATAAQIGANRMATIGDIDELLASLRELGVYTIGRIPVFKDDLLARNGAGVNLDVAVRDALDGDLWVDRGDLGWVDPFREEVWDYNVALAEEAIRRGFDEVQFDYVRFPTDPGRETTLDRAQFSQPANAESRAAAIAAFLSRAQRAVHLAGGVLSADIFGFVAWRNDDLGIGQQLELVAASVDYLSPMVYPSTFTGLPMEPSYADSASYPYETVFYSLQRARERLAGTGVALRPWLQYFDDYPWASGMTYGPEELEAQRRAVTDLGLSGWMWWDPTNRYRHGM